MNFEDAFKHYQEGIATAEEKSYVLDELAKAKAFSTLLDDEGINVTPAPLAEADIYNVRKAKKQFKMRRLMFGASMFILSLLVVATILSAVFGTASFYAKQNIVYGERDCIIAAKEFAYELLTDENGIYGNAFVGTIEDIRFDDSHLDFNYNASRIQLSYYVYRIELDAGALDIEIDVDTRNSSRCNIVSIR